MRIRNVKDKENILDSCPIYIKDPESYRLKWNELFLNDNPIYLEIGCGKCSFILEASRRYPNINFIGIERIDSVLALGIKKIDNFPKNLILINYDANYIDKIFDKEIDRLYLNFSDPWPKKRNSKRRLTHVNFLKKYDCIFKGKKVIELKTDNRDLFEFSIVSLSNFNYLIDTISLDLHNSSINDNILTEYEEKFAKKGQKIFYLKATKL